VSDDRLDQALRALPPAGPSDGFTERVVARLGETARSRIGRGTGARRRLVAVSLALAGGMVALLIVAISSGRKPSQSGASTIGELEALRREQRALQAELASLRALDEPPRRQPIIFLGQSAGIDLVLDLARLRPRPGAGGTTP
jgi:hypothetical protein